MPFGYAKFAQDSQSIRNSLVHLDALALSSRYQEHVKISKALSLVWMAACFESFWKSYLAELCGRVCAASSLKRRRYFATTSLFYFDVLGSMGDGKKLKRWDRAVELFEGLPQMMSLTSPSIPYDGRTVRPEHFMLVWKVFALPGAQFPSPIHRQELNTLANRRNDVAHGHLVPQAVGGSITVGDLVVLITRLEDIVENSILCANGRWP